MRRRFFNAKNSFSKYFSIISLEDNTVSLPTNTSPDLKYSLNGSDWIQWDYSTITLGIRDVLYLKGDNSNRFSTSSTNYNQFNITGRVVLSGNIMSLLYEDDFEDNNTLPDYTFYELFSSCFNIISAENLILPTTTLSKSCYKGMFRYCVSLTTAPNLPAITLANYCYSNMFQNCSKLNYIKAMFTTTPSSSYTSNWVYGVASTGTFVKNAAATWNVTGTSGVPSGWTITRETQEGIKIIEFTIDGTSYQAEEGMTWGEWVDSAYDNGNFNIYDTVICYSSYDYIVMVGLNSTPVQSSDIILENVNYIRIKGGGSSN